MKRTIWFDMDGTIANLYGVTDWLPKLRAYDASPYAEAEPMLNMSLLARYLNKLKAMGYTIGIISWCSKCSNIYYDMDVAAEKQQWLYRHLRSVRWDYIHITQYGTPKQSLMKATDDILFDDNEGIRNEWDGEAYEPNQILSVLKELIDRG